MVMGTKEGWEAGHVFEAFLIGTLGAEGYSGLWTGRTKWYDPKVTEALELFKKMPDYLNTDHSALTWDEAGQYLIQGKGAMLIMGDWTNGWFMSKNYNDYGWALPPGNDGIFDALSDSFGLPKGSKNRDQVIAFLRVLGSRKGQEAFNKLKGSIPARADADKSIFNPYLQSTMDDWNNHKIVPSVIHGAAASEGWATEYKDVLALFVARKDVAKAQVALAAAAEDAGVSQ